LSEVTVTRLTVHEYAAALRYLKVKANDEAKIKIRTASPAAVIVRIGSS
jgi:hypothetical protein